MTRRWGCPSCGRHDSRVLDTAYDEAGYPVRRRRCTACDGEWATEEVPIAREVFYQRGYVWSRQTRRYSHRRRIRA